MLMPRGFSKVVVLGNGNVVQERVAIALDELQRDGRITEVVYCDIDEKDFKNLSKDFPNRKFLKIKDRRNPHAIIPQLQAANMLGHNVLVLNCTATAFHVSYARALDELVGHIAIEKPIAPSAEEGRLLLEMSTPVSAIEHQIYKEEIFDLCRGTRAKEFDWRLVESASFCMFEKGPIGNREIDHQAADTGYHGLAAMLAPLSAQSDDLEIVVQGGECRTYTNGPDHPRQPTAALFWGHLVADPRYEDAMAIPFTIEVAKGVSESRKELRLSLSDGSSKIVTLNESGHLAHKRVIEAILAEEVPLLTVDNSIQIVAACCDVVDTTPAVGEDGKLLTYDFASWPKWRYRETPKMTTLSLHSAR